MQQKKIEFEQSMNERTISSHSIYPIQIGNRTKNFLLPLFVNPSAPFLRCICSLQLLLYLPRICLACLLRLRYSLFIECNLHVNCVFDEPKSQSTATQKYTRQIYKRKNSIASDDFKMDIRCTTQTHTHTRERTTKRYR